MEDSNLTDSVQVSYFSEEIYSTFSNPPRTQEVVSYSTSYFGGRWRIRTSDPCNVNAML